MRLQIITIANMINIEGTKTSPYYLKGHNAPNRPSKWTWSNQHKTCSKYWEK